MIRPGVVTAVLLVVSLLLDVVLGRSIPGFYAAYGLASCVVIIVVSKWAGKRWLQRGESYYEEGAE